MLRRFQKETCAKMGKLPDMSVGEFDPALIEESLALLAAFREIKSAEARSTVVWLAQSLAQDCDRPDLVQRLSASVAGSLRQNRLA